VRFLEARKVASLNAVDRKLLLDFLVHAKETGLCVNSISRMFVAIKVFFRHLHQEGLLAANVTDAMDSPRLWKILPDTLSEREVEALLKAPAGDKPQGLRNRALLETFYATGLRVSEMCDLTLDDLHFDAGYLRCTGKGRKERVVAGLGHGHSASCRTTWPAAARPWRETTRRSARCFSRGAEPGLAARRSGRW